MSPPANGLGLPAGISNANVSGGGVGGSITWTAIPKLLDLQVTAHDRPGHRPLWQRPACRTSPSARTASWRRSRKPPCLFGATWHATPLLDIYAYAGQEAEKRQISSTSAPTHLGLGNPAYNLAGCFTEGGACSPNIQAGRPVNAGFWWRAYQGNSAASASACSIPIPI